MTRAVLTLASEAHRNRAKRWLSQAPLGTRVEFRAPRRSIPQNDRMWAMLTDVAAQVTHCGRRYTADAWKVLFMHALGREVQFLPALDGTSFVPYGQSSSELSKQEMSDLIDFIAAWGAENGVVFNDTPVVPANAA